LNRQESDLAAQFHSDPGNPATMIHVGQQSAHHGGQGNLGQLSLGPKMLVECAQYWVAASRAEGGHV
jgi:hypothetical protein